MRILRTMLIVYCLLAAIGLAVWAWSAISRTSQLSGQISVSEDQVAQVTDVAEAKLQELRRLEAIQREGRRTFTGPEAVDASYAVQVAQEAADKSDADVKAAEASLQALLDEQDKVARVITPVIAGVLLHLLVGFALLRAAPRGLHAK